jgi:hypothetical protein
MGASAMNIRYGIWRRVMAKRQRTILHQCHVIAVNTFNWEDNRAHQRLRKRILNKHPGWSLSGYCPEIPLGVDQTLITE